MLRSKPGPFHTCIDVRCLSKSPIKSSERKNVTPKRDAAIEYEDSNNFKTEASALNNAAVVSRPTPNPRCRVTIVENSSIAVLFRATVCQCRNEPRSRCLRIAICIIFVNIYVC